MAHTRLILGYLVKHIYMYYTQCHQVNTKQCYIAASIQAMIMVPVRVMESMCDGCCQFGANTTFLKPSWKITYTLQKVFNQHMIVFPRV